LSSERRAPGRPAAPAPGRVPEPDRPAASHALLTANRLRRRWTGMSNRITLGVHRGMRSRPVRPMASRPGRCGRRRRPRILDSPHGLGAGGRRRLPRDRTGAHSDVRAAARGGILGRRDPGPRLRVRRSRATCIRHRREVLNRGWPRSG
jgi:hypothetical protein